VIEANHFVWQWPQIAWFCIAGFNLFGALLLDGAPKKANHSLAATMLALFVSAGLLYFGGFFTVARP
jgi:hypothetical protein